MSGQLESVQMLLEAIGFFLGQSRWQRNRGACSCRPFFAVAKSFFGIPWNKYLHPKIKPVEPQNGGLEAVFPFLVGDFQVNDVEFRGSSNILKKVLEGLAAFLFLEWRRNSCCHGEPFSSKRINFQPFCGAGKMCPFDKSKQLNNKMPPKFASLDVCRIHFIIFFEATHGSKLVDLSTLSDVHIFHTNKIIPPNSPTAFKVVFSNIPSGKLAMPLLFWSNCCWLVLRVAGKQGWHSRF